MFRSIRCFRSIDKNVSGLWRSGTICSIRMVHQIPIDKVNDYHGLFLENRWFFVLKRYYAADWTIPGVMKLLEEKRYEGDLSDQVIQDTIDEWCRITKLKDRPAATKLSKSDRMILDNKQLYEKQTASIVRDKKKKQKQVDLEAKKEIVKRKKKAKVQNQLALYSYVAEHGKFPDDYDYDSVTMINVWNHFAAKNYQEGGSKSERKHELSVLWKKMTAEQREEERNDCIQVMKDGLTYSCGELVPLNDKYESMKYNYIRKQEAIQIKADLKNK